MQFLCLLVLDVGVELEEGVCCVGDDCGKVSAGLWLFLHCMRFRLFGELRTLRSTVRLDNAQNLSDGIRRIFIISSSPLSSIVFLLIA